MNITIQRPLLVTALKRVGGLLSGHATLPILDHLLITAAPERLTLLATDLETEIHTEIHATSEDTHTFTVPGRKLASIAANLPPAAEIRLKRTDTHIILTAGRSRFTLATLPPEDFPRTEPAIDPPSRIELPARTLRGLLATTSYAMARQDVRYYLNGLLLELAPGTLTAVATDGHRLAKCWAEVDTTDRRQVILPHAAVGELLKLLPDTETPITLEVSERTAAVTIGPTRLGTKLIDGRYPDYARVIPDPAYTVQCHHADLLAAVSRAAILSNETYRGCRITLAGLTATVTATNQATEQADESWDLSANSATNEISVGVNIKYLQDALGVMTGEDITLKLTDGNSSCLVEDPSDPDRRALHVLMPMRL